MGQKSMSIDQVPDTSEVTTVPKSANEQPLVSVVIPCYNQGHFVNAAIDSVLAQTYAHYEIIVVDDGSTDRTSEVVGRYPCVRYVHQRNRGPNAARNHGIQESQGQYLVFLDADDRLLPEHFAISLDALKSHPHVGWVCGNFHQLGFDPTWRHVHHCDPMPDYFASLLRVNFIGAIHAVMYRRQAVVESGGFDTRYRLSEDREFYLRLIRRVPLYCHHQIVAEYRMSERQASRRWHLMLKWDINVIRSQWPFVHGCRIYEDAYYDGLTRTRTRYGELALWQMVLDARSGKWLEALRAFWVLSSYYPDGLVNLFKGKARKLFFIRKPNSSGWFGKE